MGFTATGAATKVPVQKGCFRTPGEKHKGMLRGSFDLNADKLGTVNLGSVRATLERPPHVTACARPTVVPASVGAGRQRHFLYNSPPHRGEANGFRVLAFKPPGTAPVTVEIDTFDRRTGFSAYYKYAAYVRRTDYTFSSDLSSATLNGDEGNKGNRKLHGHAGRRQRGRPKVHGNAQRKSLCGHGRDRHGRAVCVRPAARLPGRELSVGVKA
jgi:hypothetical protein